MIIEASIKMQDIFSKKQETQKQEMA